MKRPYRTALRDRSVVSDPNGRVSARLGEGCASSKGVCGVEPGVVCVWNPLEFLVPQTQITNLQLSKVRGLTIPLSLHGPDLT